MIHDETLNGDLSDSAAAPTAVGTLALGSSTVSGRFHVTSPEFSQDDPFDAFRFLVAAGTEVSAITLNFTQQSYPGGASISLGQTGGGAIGSVQTANFSIFSGDDLFTNPSFAFGGPLGAGDYTFALDGTGARFGLNSYSVQFNVVSAGHSVPEPATGLLVIGSLLALAASRRRA